MEAIYANVPLIVFAIFAAFTIVAVMVSSNNGIEVRQKRLLVVEDENARLREQNARLTTVPRESSD